MLNQDTQAQSSSESRKNGYLPLILGTLAFAFCWLVASYPEQWVWLACLAAGLIFGVGYLGVSQQQAQAMSSGAGHDLPLIQQVLPVWQRQIERARSHSEDSGGTMLASFGAISDKLEQAIAAAEGSAVQLGDHGVDDLIAENSDAIERLLEPMQQALRSRNEAYARLEDVGVAVNELRQVAIQIKQLARRINMVALNASVEASRAGDKGSSFAVVAQEVRQLATQSGDAASTMMSRTSAIDQDLQSLRSKAAAYDGSDEEMTAQADGSAREVIAGLLRSLGAASRASRQLQDAGMAVRDEVERVLVGFQSQDRLSQMLENVTADMARLTGWLEQGGDVSEVQASEWLARLDASYTMEEQRSQHHGHAVIQRETAIEFF